MRVRVLLPLSVFTLVLSVFLWAPVRVAAQDADREAAREAARKASPHSKEEAGQYWEKEVADKIAAATARVYDPNKPLPANPPRKPWGDPDISGYFVSQTYTPLERPKGVDKPLYTVEESILAFKKTVEADSAVDPADLLCHDNCRIHFKIKRICINRFDRHDPRSSKNRPGWNDRLQGIRNLWK